MGCEDSDCEENVYSYIKFTLWEKIRLPGGPTISCGASRPVIDPSAWCRSMSIGGDRSTSGTAPFYSFSASLFCFDAVNYGLDDPKRVSVYKRLLTFDSGTIQNTVPAHEIHESENRKLLRFRHRSLLGLNITPISGILRLHYEVVTNNVAMVPRKIGCRALSARIVKSGAASKEI